MDGVKLLCISCEVKCTRLREKWKVKIIGFRYFVFPDWNFLFIEGISCEFPVLEEIMLTEHVRFSYFRFNLGNICTPQTYSLGGVIVCGISCVFPVLEEIVSTEHVRVFLFRINRVNIWTPQTYSLGGVTVCGISCEFPVLEEIVCTEHVRVSYSGLIE